VIKFLYLFYLDDLYTRHPIVVFRLVNLIYTFRSPFIKIPA